MTDFKTLLKEEKARWIAQAGAELLAQTEVKRWWPDVHGDSRFAAVSYLNTKTSVLNDNEPARLYVTDPMVDGFLLSGNWRLVYAGVEDGRAGVVQVLRKGFVTSVVPNSGAAPDVDWSEFVLLNDSSYDLNRNLAVLRLNNVAPEAAHALRVYLNRDSFADIAYREDTLEGSWLRVDVSAEAEQDGSYHIDVLLRSAVAVYDYIVSGRRKTALMTEETRLYQDIPLSSVTGMVNQLITIEGYTLVDADARKTSKEGIFDLTLTLRSMVVPPGGEDILIGGSGGLFRTQLRMRRNVKDIDVEAVTAGLLQLSLIDNVRAFGGKDDGVWDIIYSQLIVPMPRIERKKSFDRREEGRRVRAAYKYVDVYEKEVTGGTVDAPVYSLVGTKKRFPTSWYPGGNDNEHREISIVKVISYSVTDPGEIQATFSGITGVGGETVQLANGLWQKTTESLSYDWWE
jgi:hypothetical protein